jgi:FG-GAP-like repeat
MSARTFSFLSSAFFCGALFSLIITEPPCAQGQVSFFSPPTYTVGGPPFFVADFNLDGKPDLLGALNTGFAVQLGNGNGTFGNPIALTGAPQAVADFNGDGKPDLLEASTGTLLVLLGNGDGTFQKPISTASGANLGPIAAGDLNGDGKADVVGVFNSSLLVYLGKGDGTFASPVSYPITIAPGTAPVTLILADANGDHNLDAILITSAANVAGQVIFLVGNGSRQARALRFLATLYCQGALFSVARC